MGMTRDEAIAIIRKEYLCVDRDCGIEKNCSKCDLVMPSKEPILEAYRMAIRALEQEPKILEAIDFAIDASNGDTNYFVGFRNGLRYAKSRIDGGEPQFENCAEQQPCEDAISRKAAIDQTYIFSKDEFLRVTNPFYYLRKRIKSLPSVKPQYTDAEIQKMQELEQAEIEKAYELGKAEQQKVGRWERDQFTNQPTCSKCGYKGWQTRYCPNCGAEMRGEQDG